MNRFHPKISIIIPVYNGTNYMREAIDSALAQGYDNKEIIVINDGSNDNGATLSVAKSYGEKIRLIDKPNGGVATALNAGIASASGDYISWLSHDDVYPPDKLEKQVAFLGNLENKNTIVFGDYAIIDEKGNKLGYISVAGVDTKRMPFELYCANNIHGCSMIIPKQVFEKTGGFREDLPTTQDYDLWLRAAGTFPFEYNSTLSVYSRQHAAQGSRTLHHDKEVRDYYLNNLLHFTPEWMDKNFSKEEIREKYLFLLRKFSRLDLLPVYFKVLKQALLHLKFKTYGEQGKFLFAAMTSFYSGSLKSFIKKIVPLPIKNMIRRNLNSPRAGNDNRPAVLDFARIYTNNIFGSPESRSGSGSTMEQTAYIRQALPELFRELGIKSILDVPCGDFHWMQHMDLSGVHYIGGDVVPEIVEKNNQKYGTQSKEFKTLNIITDDLPKTDLILCRDCLVHLNFESGLAAIQNFKRSGAKYLLTTTFTERTVNEELFGIWRVLNLQLPPYSLPKPVKMINEKCTEASNRFTDKCLGLWDLSEI